jgi:hypothetical protein
VHVVHLPGADRFQVRTLGLKAPGLIAEVLKRTSHIQTWRQAEEVE